MKIRPIKKAPIKKKTVAKKKLIVKKKAPIKKRKKPLPKVKSTRVKRMNSLITGRWTETILTAKEIVVKLGNSKNRYLKIPENEFNTTIYGDVAEVRKKENDDYIELIYRFNKSKVSDPDKASK